MTRPATSNRRFDLAWRASSLVATVLVVGALLPIAAAGQEVPELQINSTNYIVLDADTGEIFAQRGAHEQRAPASLTKVFTAIEAIESAPPSAEIVTAEEDLVSEQASQVGFSPGETFLVEDLLYGMLLPSGNDAARALARGLGAEPGDTPEQATQRFLDRLNQRLQNMGLANTHLVDPDGWGVPGHYSSAYDLALFTMYALNYPRFVRAFSTLEYESSDGAYLFKNNNRMLRTYDGIIGGKTGYDDDAGWCLINVAQRDGNRMIAVTMNGVWPDDWYDDNRVLLDYAFKQKALRAQSGAGITGEIARFRDPDAAVILAMASSSAKIGKPIPTAAPFVAPPEIDSLPAPVAREPAPTLVPAQPGVGSAGLLAAAAVAVALMALQGLSTWRPRPRREPGYAFAMRPPSFEEASLSPLVEAPATASD